MKASPTALHTVAESRGSSTIIRSRSASNSLSQPASPSSGRPTPTPGSPSTATSTARTSSSVPTRDPVKQWVSKGGRIALVDDAAHPPLATSGTGGAQAMEDGAMLGAFIDNGIENIPLALCVYENSVSSAPLSLSAWAGRHATAGTRLTGALSPRTRNS